MTDKNAPANLMEDFKYSKRRLLIFLVLVIFASVGILLFVKIRSDSGIHIDENPKGSELSFTPQDISTLRQGHYAIWGVDPTQKTTLIKRFNALNGKLYGLNGQDLLTWPIEQTDWTSFFVTIEQEGDRDETPTDYKFLECTVTKTDGKNQCLLTFSSLSATEPSGSYILSTPSDNNATVNEASGIWFTDPSGTKASLTLPAILSGPWAFEARVSSSNGATVYIGRFKQASGQDNDSRYSQREGSVYPFPGEDFLTNLPAELSGPLNLSSGNYLVTISLEPDKDGSDLSGDHPLIKLLESTIPAGLVAHTQVQLKDVRQKPQILLSF